MVVARRSRLLPLVVLCAAACSAPPEAAAPSSIADAPATAAAASATHAPADAAPAPAADAAGHVAAAPARTRPPPPSKRSVVLHVGDSFVHSGLTQRLRKLLEPLAVRYEVRAEQSTNSLDWAKRVPEAVAATQPDLVIVTLGGNEIGSRHLDVQARAIERIVKAIGDRPCVWTTPPLWMAEDGLFDVIQTHVAPCRFFETDRELKAFIPRRKDKIHPTMEGGAQWADRLFEYLLEERTGEGDAPWALRAGPPEERAPRGKREPLPQPAGGG